MDSNQIKNIVQKFFENKVSKHTLALFAKWFRLDDNRIEKDEALAAVWENSPSVIDVQTLEDWSAVKEQINTDKEDEKVKSKSFNFRKIIPYAAAAVTFIIVSTVYLTYKLVVPAPVEYTQLSVSYGEHKKLVLPDGTQVAVNAGSSLIYPKEFTSDTRTVFLSGEANFNVAQDPQKPFIVKTKHIDITALGTKFHVQSYPNDRQTKASLIEGSIQISIESDENRLYVLKPNDQLIYSHNDDQISIIDVDAEKLASWEDGYLIFQEASFYEIAQVIERKYNVVVNYDGEQLNHQSYYVKFNPDESLSDIMDVLTLLIHQSSYKIHENTVYFYKK
ncbi:MAG: fec operon regulator FecR [Bacteroidetes bacterium ADurb.Bin174]|nr:MAG: fec operon regulator FecR [Bacteroidetes bacterium ADurb.Bin174]